MREIFTHDFAISPTTWVYLSSLLMLSLFFKFNRLWSLRNVDLLAIILLAPGLVLIDFGQHRNRPPYEMAGYIWLFTIGGVLLIRMLLDSMMVRRPLLEPNLSLGGMIFLTVCLFGFLMYKVLTVEATADNLLASTPVSVKVYKPESPPEPQVLKPLMPDLGPQFNKQDQGQAEQSDAAEKNSNPPAAEAANKTAPDKEQIKDTSRAEITEQEPLSDEAKLSRIGPGWQLVRALPVLATPIYRDEDLPQKTTLQEKERLRDVFISKTILVAAHLAVVLGLVAVGYRHFGNLSTGVAAALLYLLLPYTAIYVGWVSYVLPAAFFTWAIYFYRRPFVAGIMIGLACGTVYYPVFLVTLWISFYWHRGLWRFISGLTALIGVLIMVTAWTATSMPDFVEKLRLMSGFIFPTDLPGGFWGLLDENYRVYRITVLAAHLALCGSFAIWPTQKNLGTLLSCSAALMISTQFWAAFDGGTAIGWYLPLLLLTIFRPNLEDRVALSVLPESWVGTRRLRVSKITQAA